MCAKLRREGRASKCAVSITEGENRGPALEIPNIGAKTSTQAEQRTGNWLPMKAGFSTSTKASD